MTDRIDLDEMDVGSESDDEPDANWGDWVWRDDGNPDDEPDEGWLDDAGNVAETDDGVAPAPGDADGDDEGADAGRDTAQPEANADAGNAEPDRGRLPGVPRANRDRPVGVPMESGGAGGASSAAVSDRGDGADSAVAQGGGTTTGGGTDAERDVSGAAADAETPSTASGPHGGGVDDMTMALTFDAVRRLDDPRFAVIDAKGWTDWIGIVGDVPAYEINAFQREHEIDVDFFSGAGQGPAERLADVDEHSMFYAERMVLVGVDGEESLADRVGWEFVPLETAAANADWDRSDDA